MEKGVLGKVIALDLLTLCFASSVSIVGQMLEPIGSHYSLNLTQASWLVSSQSVGGLILALMCILYIDRLNEIRILLVSGLILGVMLVFIGLSIPIILLLAVFMLLGFSGSSVNALTNSIMSDTATKNTDRHLNLLHMVFSFGAVVTPILSQFLFERYNLKGVFLVFGAFAIICVVYSVIMFRKQSGEKPKAEKITMKRRVIIAMEVMNKKGMKLVFFIAISISGWQMIAVYYLSSYFSGLGDSANYGAAALSIFFLSMMISRLFYSRIAGKYSKGKVLMITNLIGLGFWAAMFFVPGIYAKIAMSGLTGFICANNFPIVFSSAFKIAPNSKAAGSGFVGLGYYIALLVFMPIVGSIGDAVGLEYSLFVAVIPLILTAVFAWRLHKSKAIVPGD